MMTETVRDHWPRHRLDKSNVHIRTSLRLQRLPKARKDPRLKPKVDPQASALSRKADASSPDLSTWCAITKSFFQAGNDEAADLPYYVQAACVSTCRPRS